MGNTVSSRLTCCKQNSVSAKQSKSCPLSLPLSPFQGQGHHVKMAGPSKLLQEEGMKGTPASPFLVYLQIFYSEASDLKKTKVI